MDLGNWLTNEDDSVAMRREKRETVVGKVVIWGSVWEGHHRELAWPRLELDGIPMTECF